MGEGINRQFLIAARPSGMVKESDFEYHEAPIPEPGEGEVLVRTLMVAVEPALRGQMENRADYAAPLEIGDVMRGTGGGQVVKSNHPDFKEGDLVTGQLGFQEYFLASGDPLPIHPIPNGADIEAALSVFGGSGFTAFQGMLEIGQPTEGSQVLVSGAAGAVGTIAGQLAKIHGARVVGIAGSKEKCDFITEELGFDEAINYKTEDVAARVKALFPDGMDIYYDNVGGEILDIALDNLAMNAKVVLCGGISRYNKSGPIPGPVNYFNLVYRRATMHGFIVVDRVHKFGEWAKIMAPWIAEGKLKFKTDVIEGFENLPKGLIRLFTGENTGKQLIKIADPN